MGCTLGKCSIAQLNFIFHQSKILPYYCFVFHNVLIHVRHFEVCYNSLNNNTKSKGVVSTFHSQ